MDWGEERGVEDEDDEEDVVVDVEVDEGEVVAGAGAHATRQDTRSEWFSRSKNGTRAQSPSLRAALCSTPLVRTASPRDPLCSPPTTHSDVAAVVRSVAVAGWPESPLDVAAAANRAVRSSRLRDAVR